MTRSAKTFSIVLTLALAVMWQTSCTTIAKSPPQTAAKDLEASSATSGKVVETIDVTSYTYLCLEKNGRKTWFAVPLMKVTPGQEVSVRPGFEMANFMSRELNRSFEKIIFSDGTVGNQDASSNEAMIAHGEKAVEVSKGKIPGSTANAPVSDNIKVDKATGPNAFTVGELYEKKGALDKQRVVVRGAVVKVSEGVMGKNWVHLRDGSGDAAKHTDNLVVTSQDRVAVGDVVTANGTIYKDKDFGVGYKYDLIMEEASVKH